MKAMYDQSGHEQVKNFFGRQCPIYEVQLLEKKILPDFVEFLKKNLWICHLNSFWTIKVIFRKPLLFLGFSHNNIITYPGFWNARISDRYGVLDQGGLHLGFVFDQNSKWQNHVSRRRPSNQSNGRCLVLVQSGLVVYFIRRVLAPPKFASDFTHVLLITLFCIS
jgi:hypothetical protein